MDDRIHRKREKKPCSGQTDRPGIFQPFLSPASPHDKKAYNKDFFLSYPPLNFQLEAWSLAKTLSQRSILVKSGHIS
jgi:hypothetical protein